MKSFELDGSGAAFEVRITAPEIDIIVDDFDLDSDQKSIVESMFSGFEPNARRSQTAFLKQMLVLRQALHGDSNGTVIFVRQAAQANQAWRIERAEIEKRFLDDVQAILTDDQAENWPAYRLHQRRRWTLAERAEFAGESIDLVKLASAALPLTPAQSRNNPILKQYALEMDLLLLSRNLDLDQIEDLTAQRDRPAAGALSNLLKNATRNRIAIVALNQKFVENLAQSLDSTTADNLRLSFEELSFPLVFADNEADRYFQLVRALEDLTEQQTQQLESIKAHHHTQITNINHALVALQFKHQNLQALSDRTGSENPRARTTHLIGEIQVRINDLNADKITLLTKTINSIFAILTPEQQERLPKPSVKLVNPDDLTTMIDQAIDFAATNLELPEGMDRQEFVAAIRLALQGMRLKGLTISAPTFNAQSKTEDPILITGAGAPGEGTVTIPIEPPASDNKDQNQDDGG